MRRRVLSPGEATSSRLLRECRALVGPCGSGLKRWRAIFRPAGWRFRQSSRVASVIADRLRTSSKARPDSGRRLSGRRTLSRDLPRSGAAPSGDRSASLESVDAQDDARGDRPPSVVGDILGHAPMGDRSERHEPLLGTLAADPSWGMPSKLRTSVPGDDCQSRSRIRSVSLASRLNEDCTSNSAEAYAHGLALALPEEVSVPAIPARGRPRNNMALARPTGVGRALTTYEMPIERRDEWIAAAGARSA